MPEVYDRPGNENHDRRMQAALERYKDEKKVRAEEESTPWKEQEKWENEQIGKTKASRRGLPCSPAFALL